MIYGIGTDIVEISRIKDKINKSPGFINLVFSSEEQKYCNSKSKPDESFAARFAAKEAFLKALKTGMYATFNLSKIEILNDNMGSPNVILSDEIKEITIKTIGAQYFNVHVSLSHTTAFATAMVVIEII